MLGAAAKHLTPCLLELGGSPPRLQSHVTARRARPPSAQPHPCSSTHPPPPAGKSPCIVDKSASLRHAARRLVWGSFLNAGQTCVRPDFVLVHEAVAEEFFALVKEACAAPRPAPLRGPPQSRSLTHAPPPLASAPPPSSLSRLLQFYGADPQRSEWLGRCVNDAAFQRLQRLLNGPCAQGKLLVGGGADASDRYVEPTVLDYGSDLAAFMRCAAMQDEIFGPILPAARFSSLEQVVALIKGLPTGKPLALYCFAQDAAFIDVIRRRTTSGALDINDSMMQLANTELPFGGVGASGMGAYHGKHTFEAFTHEKAVLEKSQWLDNLLAPARQRAWRAGPSLMRLWRVVARALSCPVVLAPPRSLSWSAAPLAGAGPAFSALHAYEAGRGQAALGSHRHRCRQRAPPQGVLGGHYLLDLVAAGVPNHAERVMLTVVLCHTHVQYPCL